MVDRLKDGLCYLLSPRGWSISPLLDKSNTKIRQKEAEVLAKDGFKLDCGLAFVGALIGFLSAMSHQPENYQLGVAMSRCLLFFFIGVELGNLVTFVRASSCSTHLKNKYYHTLP